MTPPETLLAALAARDGLYQLTGRRLDDLTTEGDEIVTLLAATTRQLAKHGYGVITFSLSEGARLYAEHLPEEQGNELRAALQRHNLNTKRPLSATINGLLALLREPQNVIVLILDADNCFPATERPYLSEEERALREHVARLGSALWLQKNGNALILTAEPGSIDASIEAAATKIRLTIPQETEKVTFLEALSLRYPNAHFTDNINVTAAAKLTSGTTNRATEALFRRAHCNREPITARQLNQQKQEALVEQTHGVLRLLDTSGLPALVGRYLEPLMHVLSTFFACLLRGDKNLSPLLVLHGPPGVGKTLAAKWAAKLASVLVLELQSQRASLVGESERNSRILHGKRLEPAFTPHGLFTDELAHITTTRNGNDGGVTATLFGDWLSALADPRYRGKSLIIATTNVPESLPVAFHSRCEFFPVFSPAVEDLAAILVHRCNDFGLADGDDVCRAAAHQIATKGGSPRDLDRMLRRVARETTQPTWQDISTAADNLLVPDSQWQAAMYCDLTSLLTMSDKLCLPWSTREEMPGHLAAVIDDNLNIDYDQVRARLQDLGMVNV